MLAMASRPVRSLRTIRTSATVLRNTENTSHATPTNEAIFSVSEIAQVIRQFLERSFHTIALQGEISNFIQHTSGHRYFTLKDDSAQIKAVMWRSTPLRFAPTNGIKVIARGTMTMYAPQGSVQFECRSLEPLGAGDAQRALEALQNNLRARGWFDAARKKPLPRFPQTIGVVTSQSGAALHDILVTLARRMPNVHVLVRPTQVQGDGADEDIATAIEELQDTTADVLIVGRGGGSAEDLWAFNSERVATAIVHSRIPVISAVGHETDVTIADFVADVRAATPTAAAELAVRDRQELLQALSTIEEHCLHHLTTHLHTLGKTTEYLSRHHAFQNVHCTLSQQHEQCKRYTERMSIRTKQLLSALIQQQQTRSSHLASLFPLAPFDRGFVLLKKNGRILSATDSIDVGDCLTIVRQHHSQRNTKQYKISVIEVIEIAQ
jgi:exodeoxyribonuclease VII large subunit